LGAQRKYSFYPFAVVHLNWDIDTGCLRGRLFRKRTEGVVVEEVGRSSESGVELRSDDSLHIRSQYYPFPIFDIKVDLLSSR
jgi:hypothetical protein